ncbi:MAG: CPBP family intramembrane metalloprotease [Cyclobacteriaceae bacterium]|nr:CPBP family intramembrane metalloprotease [Cyclobacteriaceae bacterium]
MNKLDVASEIDLPKPFSNWKRLFIFVLLWIATSVVLYVPIVILFPTSSLLLNSGELLSIGDNNYYVVLAISQSIALLSVLFATYVVVKRIEKRDFINIGLTVDLRSIILGFLIGGTLMIAFTWIAVTINIITLSFSDISAHLGFGFGFYLLVSVTEEIVIRGYVLNNLREKLRDDYSVIISSLIFSCLHIFNDNFSWIGFSNIFLSGVLLGIFCIKQNTVSGSVGLHWSWNFIQGPILGFNVSGHIDKGVFGVNPLASNMFTGGNFGAEGSILLTPIILISIFLVVRIRYFTKFQNS